MNSTRCLGHRLPARMGLATRHLFENEFKSFRGEGRLGKDEITCSFIYSLTPFSLPSVFLDGKKRAVLKQIKQYT